MFKNVKKFKSSFYSTNRSYRMLQRVHQVYRRLRDFLGIFLVNREYREETRRQRGTHCCSHVSHAPHKVITKSISSSPLHSTSPYPFTRSHRLLSSKTRPPHLSSSHTRPTPNNSTSPIAATLDFTSPSPPSKPHHSP